MSEKFDFVATLPGLAVAKNLDSTFISMSHDFARLLGWKSEHDCPGKTDYDIPCQASEFAHEFVKMDKQVFETGKRLLALDVQNYSAGRGLVLSEKNPVKDQNGKIVAFFHPCIDVTKVSIFRAYACLHQFDSKFTGNTFKQTSYILTKAHSPLPLTDKQENVLFLLVRGKTSKEIANILHISPRTVECHIDALKNKLKCLYKSDLIEKAIDNGFLYYVPEDLQKNKLDKILMA
jgi:DNA-binding CsgD family transcriptional regulator